MAALSILLQFVIALLIVLVLFSVGFFVYNSELLAAIRSTGTNRRKVPVFEGVLDIGLARRGENNVYDTMNPAAPNYVDLTPAYNEVPGAGFTYNFWLYLDYSVAPMRFNDSEPTSQKEQDPGLHPTDYILLVRGDATPKTYTSLCNNRTKSDILVKAPLVKLENGWDNLTVEFNTVSSPDAVNEAARGRCGTVTSNDWSVVNNHKISVYGLRSGVNASRFDNRWFMVTVVVKDTSPADPLPLRNKARCVIYINGQKELDRYVDGEIENVKGYTSVLKQNTGNLHVNPKVALANNTFTSTAGGTSTNLLNSTSIQANGAQKVMMADLTYYNYDLDAPAIQQLFSAGFTKKVAPTAVDPQRLDQSYLNKMSIASSKPQLQYF